MKYLETRTHLLLGNAHVVLHIGEDSWLYKEAHVANALAASLQLGALLLAAFNVAQDFGQHFLIDLGSLLDISLEGIAHLAGLGLSSRLGHKLVVDFLVHVSATAGAAALAVIGEQGLVGGLHGKVN